jgi:phosphate transport system substrate-binding protein
MKTNLFLSLTLSLFIAISGGWLGPGAASAQTVTITGAGASFPYPIYARWADEYNKQTGVQLNYQSIGSGGGIQQIKAKTVDFGASDAPLKKEELDAAGLVQFPMVMGGVVVVVNLPGIGANQLKLDGTVLADIFLGKVKKWNDPAIAALNPGLALPALAISVVHRADGSGTTWLFTNYLDKVSPDWHAKAGCNKEVAWPVGMGGKGNEGVTAYVQKVKGGIGYVEYAYAVQNKLGTVQLKNRAGQMVAPTMEAFQEASASADWQNAPGFYMVLTDQPGEKSWPITGASFILMHREQADAAKARQVLKFFDWCLANGDAAARKLDYVPMPKSVAELVRSMWKKDIRAAGAPVFN